MNLINKMLFIRQIFFGLGLLAATHPTQAALISLEGDHFSVTYDDTQLGPYSPGLLSGSLDTVYFHADSFQAIAPGDAPAPAALELTLAVDSGHTFAGLSFTQEGSYYLYADGTARVGTSLTLANLATSDSAMLTWDTGSGLDQVETLLPWELAGLLGPVGGAGAPQTFRIALDSTLFADAADGFAFIQNTYAGFRIMTAPAAVPEPASLSLLLAGMLAAILAGRRKCARPARAGRSV